MPAAGAPWPVGEARVQAAPALLPVQAANMGATGLLALPWLDADDWAPGNGGSGGASCADAPPDQQIETSADAAKAVTVTMVFMLYFRMEVQGAVRAGLLDGASGSVALHDAI